MSSVGDIHEDWFTFVPALLLGTCACQVNGQQKWKNNFRGLPHCKIQLCQLDQCKNWAGKLVISWSNWVWAGQPASTGILPGYQPPAKPCRWTGKPATSCSKNDFFSSRVNSWHTKWNKNITWVLRMWGMRWRVGAVQGLWKAFLPPLSVG